VSGRQPVLIRTIAEMRQALKPHRTSGSRVGLVPTMGALHAGHASLMRRARSECNTVVASIYVNPTQFGPDEDFDRYPRQLQQDLAVCGQEGAAFVFAPPNAEMYGGGSLTSIHVAKLSERLCGPFRPGHFDGVCTVVAKLFHIVQPDLAYFGQKDAQQVAILKRMVADLNFPLEIVVCPTVREADGLAMATRNAYLTAQQRQRAACLYEALRAGRDAIQSGVETSGRVAAIMRDVVLAAGPVVIDYMEAVDAHTLEPTDGLAGTVLLAGAIRIGTTRLIDNLVVEVPQGS
jgi:pantoate--beta-alanine ligase